MSDERGYPGTAVSPPTHWLVGGLVLGLVAGLFFVSDDDAVQSVGAVLVGLAGLILTIGAIAKGVEVGIRNARD